MLVQKRRYAFEEATKLWRNSRTVFPSFNVSAGRKSRLIRRFLSLGEGVRSIDVVSGEIAPAATERGRRGRRGGTGDAVKRRPILGTTEFFSQRESSRSRANRQRAVIALPQSLAFFVRQVEIGVMLMEFREISANHMLYPLRRRWAARPEPEEY